MCARWGNQGTASGRIMPLTLAQAAAETGMHRSSILRAIRRGTIIGQQSSDGQWSVEPAELFRILTPAAVRAQEDAELRQRLALAEQRLSDMQAMLEEMRAQRDGWQRQAERIAPLLPAPAPAQIAPAPAQSAPLSCWLRSPDETHMPGQVS
jgi:hypothetical protein